MQSRVWLRVAVLAAVVAPFLIVLDLVFGLPHLVGYEDTSIAEIVSRRSFDSADWKKARVSDESIRIKMVDDLLRTHRLVGMSRTQIDALLGAPDETTYFSRTTTSIGWDRSAASSRLTRSGCAYDLKIVLPSRRGFYGIRLAPKSIRHCSQE